MLLAALVSRAGADRKSFTNTYEYATLPEGQTELELWHTEAQDAWGKATQRFEEKLEIEHGITDHWDAAMYTVFSEVSASDPTVAAPLGLDSVRVETRYRFADRGQLPVDPVAYLEVGKDFGHSHYELEGKAIFARDFDRITAAVNLIGEITVGNDVPSTLYTVGWAGGATYEITPKLRLGAETWGSHVDGTTRWAVGPAIGLAPSSKLWVAITAGFGIVTAPTALLDQNLSAVSGRVVMGLAI